MAEKITDTELVTLIDEHINDSLGYSDEIAKQRELSMEYYLGNPDGLGNEVDGRSHFVSSDVQDIIEWIMPSLMRVFTSGDEICTFNPVGPEDSQAAQQATQYVNHVLMKQNQGWTLLYDFFKTAILQKNGFLKVWWDDNEKQEREEYTNLTDIELDALISDEDVEVVEHTSKEMEVVENQFIDVHDIVITRNTSEGQVQIEGVPPDELLVARLTKDIQDAHFICHRVRKTVTELREMGYDIDPDVLSSGSSDMDQWSGERQSRYSFDNSDNIGFWGGKNTFGSDKSMEELWLKECYVRADVDGDGLAELRRVVMVGHTILENEEVDSIPFVSITPIRIPYKFFGLSVADITMDLQLIKSTMMRNLLDNAYNQNFGRYAVLEGQANLDDLLTQRPGGVVRVKSPNAVTPLSTPPLEPYSFQMLEYLDGIRESRAGVSRSSTGLNPDILKSHQTATAVSQVMTASQQRVELIARNFAETGVKDLCQTIYSLLIKHQDRETVVQLRGEWVPINPSMWKTKTDCTVSTGIGFGSKNEQMAYLSQMIQFASQAMSGGLQIVNEQNMYQMSKELVKSMGFANYQDFLTDPSQIEPGPDPEQQYKQAEANLRAEELKIKMGELQLKQQKLQQDAAEAQVDAQLKMAELALEKEQNRAVAIGAT